MRGLFAGLLFAALAFAAAPPGRAQSADNAIHIGVVSCAGDNCHGAVRRFPGASVAQDEYLIWKQKDKHHLAFAVLRDERATRIARNLGLESAESAPVCLECHADNVPPARRGPRFDLADGVGCEACHGGGGAPWLGLHIAGVSHRENIAAGLYPTDDPTARAQRCLHCHVGESGNFVTHKIMGAGHPPMGFELDTYTAIQPAHFTVDKIYVERKGRPNDMRLWAVGQATDLKKRMDLLLDPQNAPKGATPELSLFDCQACHHAMSELQWRPRAATGLDPGSLRLYDASAVMLRIVAGAVAPDAAAALDAHLPRLHAATAAAVPDYWSGVRQEAVALRQIAEKAIPVLQQHEFTRDEVLAVARALVALGAGGGDLDYSGAQQEVMALESVVAAIKSMGYAEDAQVNALNDALGGLYTAVASDQSYRPDAFVAALRGLEEKLPR